MKIDFPRSQAISSDVHFEYNLLVDQHLHHLKQQSKLELFYWKTAGFFFLYMMTLFVLRDKGIVQMPSIAILVSGAGCLAVFFLLSRLSLEEERKATVCVQTGVELESQYALPGRLLGDIDDNKRLFYRGNVLSRAIPVGFVWVVTIIAGVAVIYGCCMA